MSNFTHALAGTAPLSLSGVRNWAIHLTFVASTVLLPMVAHILGWPVLVVLPMFWGILLAGIVYGWQGGLLAGIAAPVLNTLITGMPPIAILPAMMVELVAYGTLPALLGRRASSGAGDRATAGAQVSGADHRGIPAPLALLAALIVGRILLVGIWSVTAGSPAGVRQFATVRLLPGIPVQLLQVVLVPLVAEALKGALRADGTDEHAR